MVTKLILHNQKIMIMNVKMAYAIFSCKNKNLWYNIQIRGDIMNKKYMYANGNIHIFDENNNKTVIEYTDNFIPKLVRQNNLESIKNTITVNNELINFIIEYESKLLLEKASDISLITIGSTAAGFFLKAFCDIQIDNLPLILAVLGLEIGILITNKKLEKMKEMALQIKAYKKLSAELSYQYSKNMSILKEIEENKLKEQEEIYKQKQFEIFDLDDSLEQKNLQALINATIFYEMNKEEYIKLFKLGLLEEETTNLLPRELLIVRKNIYNELYDKQDNKQLKKKEK